MYTMSVPTLKCGPVILQEAFSVMCRLQSQGILCDLQIHTSTGYVFEVHKIVMVATCSYFQDLVWKSGFDNSSVSFPHLDHITLGLIIKFIYGEEIIPTDAKALYQAAKTLGIPDLATKCQDIILNFEPSHDKEASVHESMMPANVKMERTEQSDDSDRDSLLTFRVKTECEDEFETDLDRPWGQEEIPDITKKSDMLKQHESSVIESSSKLNAPSHLEFAPSFMTNIPKSNQIQKGKTKNLNVEKLTPEVQPHLDHVCKECGTVLRSERGLFTHVKRLHPDIFQNYFPYCHMCGKSFFTTQAYNQHVCLDRKEVKSGSKSAVRHSVRVCSQQRITELNNTFENSGQDSTEMVESEENSVQSTSLLGKENLQTMGITKVAELHVKSINEDEDNTEIHNSDAGDVDSAHVDDGQEKDGLQTFSGYVITERHRACKLINYKPLGHKRKKTKSKPAKKSRKKCKKGDLSDDEYIPYKPQKKKVTTQKKLSCDKCDFTTKIKRELAKHNALHRSEKYRKCKICDIWFRRSVQLDTHNMRVHAITPNYHCVCHKCGKEFYRQSKMTAHLKVCGVPVREKPFKCSVCDFRTNVRLVVKQHEFLKHKIHSEIMEKNSRVCEICGLTLPSAANYRKHKKTHTKNYDFTCDQCGKGFHSSGQLKVHILRRHEKVRNYFCSECPYAALKLIELHRHERVMHRLRGLKPFKCAYCEFSSAMRVNCMNHTRKLHPQQTTLCYQVLDLEKGQPITPKVLYWKRQVPNSEIGHIAHAARKQHSESQDAIPTISGVDETSTLNCIDTS